MTTKIDAEDFERLKSEGLVNWCAQKSGKRFYVSRTIHGSGKLYLHRHLMNCPPGLCIDHINRDSLDNRKENLRFCSYRQNSANKAGIKEFKGVTLHRGKWIAQIRINGNHTSLGTFSTAADAARAYDIAACLIFKEFAFLNFDFSKKFLKLLET